MNITHRIGIKSPVSSVYAALATIDGLAGWWTRDTTGLSERGGHIAFRFRTAAGDDIGSIGLEVLELTPDHAVRWRVNGGPPEWVGTEIESFCFPSWTASRSCTSAIGNGATTASSWPTAARSGRPSC